MTKPTIHFWSAPNFALIAGAFIVGIGIMAALGTLLVTIQNHKSESAQYPLKAVDIPSDELDPAVWGRNFPRQYDSFLKTANDTIDTPYGGSIAYSKLERHPAMVRLWAGYAFSLDHNEERGHYYALTDQKMSRRVTEFKQPGACANCHAAEAPLLIAEMGWENFNATPYDELKNRLHTNTSCADCHDPATTELRITRPAFTKAMLERGINLANATRQEMRSYVCAQCHVEYYFSGENKVLTFPWRKGMNIDDIESYYDSYAFKDWTHKETGAPMIKIQHPEFEMWSSGLHARSGVACADCHMPYVRDGAVKVSDHWIRSPLANINTACQVCHRQTEKELRDRVTTIQDSTSELLRRTEAAIVQAIDAIVRAQTAGASDTALGEARHLHRRASIRWDFVSSENSMGFHSPQEAARILATAIDYGRQAQLVAERAMPR
ncbi:MAG: ammonia-forming cytochrome c nitrite reductase subunit c552 [Chloroflexota bacterium]|mgnify:CR=1 FL=1